MRSGKMALWVGVLLIGAIFSIRTAANGVQPLLNDDFTPTEDLVEALLYPSEHRDMQFVYISEGEEAVYCLDSSLSAKEPFAQVYPERIEWPTIGGVSLQVASLDLKLLPNDADVTDAVLDEGFAIRWFLTAEGQDFSNAPVFKLRAVGAEVFSTKDAKVLFSWQKAPLPQICDAHPKPGFPTCSLGGVSMETQAIAVDPLGERAAVAVSGLKPGIDVYDIREEPHRIWQILFPYESGGALDVSFSSDGRFVAALLGNGEIHRFDAATGGRHLAIPSQGFTAHAVPPGNIVAVGGKNGELVLWRLDDGTIEWKLEGRNFRGDIDDISVSGNGKVLATLEYTDTETIVRIWKIKQKNAPVQINLPETGYNDILLDHNGGKLYLSHESKGMMMLPPAPKAAPLKIGNAATACTHELFTNRQQTDVSCSVPGGILKVDAKGSTVRDLKIDSQGARWMVDQSPSGVFVAVGNGTLLLWR